MVDHAIFQTLSFWMCKRGKPSFPSIRRHSTAPLCDLLYFKINYENYNWTTWNCCSEQIPAVFLSGDTGRIVSYLKWQPLAVLQTYFIFFLFTSYLFSRISWNTILWQLLKILKFSKPCFNWIFVSFLPYL